MTKKPSYRFAGYTESWEEKKLGEVAELLNGRAYKQEELLEDGEYRVLRVGNFNTNDKWYYSDLQLEDSKYANYGDLLYLWATNFGPELWKEEKVIYHYHIWKISGYSNILDKYYFYTFLEKDKDRIKQNTNGSTMVHITKGMMEERVLTFPSLPEQTAIGSFFQDIDQLISLQQRKLEVLKEQKKTYLKLLFPAKGQIKPALRFAGFEDDWKEVKLGEVTNRYDNLRVPVSANERISGDTPYYGANGIQDYVDGYTHDGEFILIAEDGASDLKDYPVQYVNGKVWVNNHAHVIQGKKDLINNIFLLFAVKQINIEPFLVGGGRAKLNSDIMMKLPLHLPPLPEQEAIGSFFQNLDKAIAKQEEKVNQLKESKQTLLRKMFI
ncbi:MULTISPECIES: restriction endonuclease subunit S [Streptococcus mitis group]|uniref:Type I restriction modification DNA specificity domain protein n=1 Tax=Streptococcus mitis TaxID=28037 RepID=A0A081PUM3_STRMT|nr:MULTISPECIES: restriction endonuclease subunit S [Streptococcus]KEQ34396.1 type I restriction modification DNA specificity domain protein [Streptococcus mitis]MDB0075889.1 restriction endonuclease subunit S [Streptococcus gwangjuense]